MSGGSRGPSTGPAAIRTLTSTQQRFLEAFFQDTDESEPFYLSGGTALAGFYLHHRYSDDLDFFTRSEGAVTGADPRVMLEVVVGRPRWHAEVIERAMPARVEGVEVPAARAADLILLKLYAGGPQDAWDITQLLASPDRNLLVAEVEARLPDLPPDARALWTRIIDVGQRP